MTNDQYSQAQSIKADIQKVEDIEYDLHSSSAFNRLPEELRMKICDFTQSLKDELEQKFGEL